MKQQGHSIFKKCEILKKEINLFENNQILTEY